MLDRKKLEKEKFRPASMRKRMAGLHKLKKMYFISTRGIKEIERNKMAFELVSFNNLK